MSEPRDLRRGLGRYATFHALDPKDVGTLRTTLKIPTNAVKVGRATFTAYRSSKWEDKNNDYWHDHEGGPSVYLPAGEGPRVAVPARIQQTSTFVLLGACLGFGYATPDGEEVEAKVSRPYPEVYTSPTGKTLFFVENKSRLVAMIWGPGLDVRAEGIVG